MFDKNQQTESNFWVDKSDYYTDITNSLLSNVLHKEIVDFVNQQNPTTYLDFGCGDGRMSELLNPEIPICIYDISDEMLSKAKQRLNNRIEKIYTFLEEIPSNTFEIVVCCMVILCIDKEEEFINSLSAISRCLSKNGKAIIATTHPCFMPFNFSNYDTDFSNGRPFYYFLDGQPFNVTIRDHNTNKSVSFNDYHWTLSTTVNKIISNGMRIEKIIETTDDFSMEHYNLQHSPFITLIVSKL